MTEIEKMAYNNGITNSLAGQATACDSKNPYLVENRRKEANAYERGVLDSYNVLTLERFKAMNQAQWTGWVLSHELKEVYEFFERIGRTDLHNKVCELGSRASFALLQRELTQKNSDLYEVV